MIDSIILASSSPRRRELLTQAGIRFTIMVKPVDEHTDLFPRDAVLHLSVRKAKAVADALKNGVVLGCDTLVSLKGKAIGKPADRDDAIRMLMEMSGKTHSVYSGVCLIDASNGKMITGVAETLVTFRDLSLDEVTSYVDTGEPMDKAGSYAIQGGAKGFVTGFSGSYENIIGLPMQLLKGMMECI